jgi:riboflavin kinase / FMN adenylyltransferase
MVAPQLTPGPALINLYRGMSVQVYRGLESIDPPMRGVTLTFGNFDGVHRGHQQILAQAGMLAERAGSQVVAVTFEPHPLRLVAPQRAVHVLTPLHEKIDLLGQAGADAVVVVEPTLEFLNQSPDQFVSTIVSRFSPLHVVEGPSWRFGRGREGDVAALQRFGLRHGFEVFIVPALQLEIDPEGSIMVTSTLIRDLIARHHVHRAALCLGRPYALSGRIVHGRGRGRGLGFPTANIDAGEQLLPGEGVYAGRAVVDGRRCAAAISVGTNPTFGDGTLSVEAYLLDYQGEPYDRPIRMEFLRWLRDQKRFESAEALTRQMHQDVEQVRRVCEAAE